MFTYDLNDWVMVDEKSDGWREVPVHWPALPQPKGIPLIPHPTHTHTHTHTHPIKSNDIIEMDDNLMHA